MTKAIVIRKTGGPEVLSYEDVTLPPPGKGEVRVRHTAIGVNYLDVYYRTGLYPSPSLPFTPGSEGAGIVTALGEGVRGICLSPLKLSHYDGANGRVLGWLGSGIRMRTA